MTDLFAVCTILLLAGCALAQPPADTQPAVDTEREVELTEAVKTGDYARIIELTDGVKDGATPEGRLRANAFQLRGQDRFFAAKIAESISDFDAYLQFFPERDPHHWQRGISCYYAADYAAGKAQFERHQKVNTQDVENAVWHFLCAVRTKDGSVEKSRENLIPIERDTRVPMKQIHDLFSGKGTVEDVMEVSKSRNDQCYAHLYVGLYYEAIGDNDKARLHMERSANEFRMNHYMGKVSQVHAKLRGWKSPLE